jgi:nicotinate-nucleotide pyrophosphorylase (carboxylating)
MTAAVPSPDREAVARAVLAALQEDLDAAGDVTSEAVIPEEQTARALIVARSEGVLCGLPVAREVFSRVGARLRPGMDEGGTLRPGAEVAAVGGALRAILAAERTALNFLGRLSGVATQAGRYVEALAGTGAVVRDTRKTTPGLRVLEKYAARVGGAENHRLGLFDALFLKDNHVISVGGVVAAVRMAKEARPDLPLIVEVETPQDAEAAAQAGAEEVLLDNMAPEAMREAVARVAGRARVEASGGVSLDTVRAVAETGVDTISAGGITHGATWLDFSLEVQPDVALPEEPDPEGSARRER